MALLFGREAQFARDDQERPLVIGLIHGYVISGVVVVQAGCLDEVGREKQENPPPHGGIIASHVLPRPEKGLSFLK